MRKSNFFKKAFSSVGTSSPHFQKIKAVTFNIVVLLMLLGSAIVGGAITVFAQENITNQEVTSSVPDSDVLAELTSINYRLDDINSTLESDIAELQDTNKNLEILIGVNGHIFGGIFLIIVCILFIALYKLFNTFFRF